MTDRGSFCIDTASQNRLLFCCWVHFTSHGSLSCEDSDGAIHGAPIPAGVHFTACPVPLGKSSPSVKLSLNDLVYRLLGCLKEVKFYHNLTDVNVCRLTDFHPKQHLCNLITSSWLATATTTIREGTRLKFMCILNSKMKNPVAQTVVYKG